MRESTLVSMAGTMWKRGFVVDAIRAALWVHNSQACTPPLDESDIERIAGSVTRYERDNLDVSTVVAALQRRQK
jgi:putative DNA primase/helicase